MRDRPRQLAGEGRIQELRRDVREDVLGRRPGERPPVLPAHRDVDQVVGVPAAEPERRPVARGRGREVELEPRLGDRGGRALRCHEPELEAAGRRAGQRPDRQRPGQLLEYARIVDRGGADGEDVEVGAILAPAAEDGGSVQIGADQPLAHPLVEDAHERRQVGLDGRRHRAEGERMPARSFWRPIRKTSTMSAIPSTEMRSNTARDTIRPRSRSSTIMNTWPPSSGRNGRRLKMASESEMYASRVR